MTAPRRDRIAVASDESSDVVGTESDSAPEGTALRLVDVSKNFGDFSALRDVTLDVPQGAMVSVLGPSGCGKTTLMRIIAGLETPTGGSVFVHGRQVDGLPAYRRNIGLVFQNYGLFPHMSVRDNVAYGARRRGLDAKSVRQRVEDALNMVQLTGLEERRPRELSGGQRQRVALSRAIATNPELLLLDEPLSALDAKLREHVRQEIRQLQERLGLTTLLVTHDQDEALSMAHLVVIMREGRIEQVGTPHEVYSEPVNAYVADFVGACNLIPASVVSAGTSEVSARFLGQTDHVRTPHVVLSEGRQIRIMARPEELEVTERAEPPQRGMNYVDGKIVLSTYLGHIAKYDVAVDGEGGMLLQVSVADPGERFIAEGSAVKVGWPAGCWRHLPGESTPQAQDASSAIAQGPR